MSRITKQIAQEVAEKLTEKQVLEINKMESDIKDQFTEIYLKTVPKEILDLFEKHPKYFETRSNFQIHGNGFQFERLCINNKYPSKQYLFSMNEKDSEKMMILFNKLSDKKKELSKFKIEIEALIFGLRTYAKVNSEFPEASPFLPKTISNSLMVNISDLREKLKK